ncbi:MAG: putative methyltransferase [Phenylobacterium sp.]|jgi:predicted methyltransferase
MKRLSLTLLLATSASLILLNTSLRSEASSTPSVATYQQMVEHQDRPKGDLRRDKSRLPAQLLQFMQLKPGMTVFELGAGGGYTTELLARAVGQSGKVFSEGLNLSRVTNNRLPQVKPLERGLIYQIPDRAAAAGLKNGQVDSVVIMFTYHDLALNGRIDRQDMLHNLLAMLKPGGSLIIADNAAVDGSGLRDTQSLHRIDSQLVRKELEQAGFTFANTSTLYHNAKDDKKGHWRFMSGQHARMLMRFTK